MTDDHATDPGLEFYYLLFSIVATAAIPIGRPTVPQPAAVHIQPDAKRAVRSAGVGCGAGMFNPGNGGAGVGALCDAPDAMIDKIQTE
jgi:hypothetical protein